MGTCCAGCLPTKVRDYASNAENGAVTVTRIKNPPRPPVGMGLSPQAYLEWLESLPKCDVCGNRAEFTASYHKKTGSIRANVLSADKIIGRDNLRI